ncbi:MAG: calcium-binding protein [Hyphomicrobiaceae bacterium]
MATIKGTSLRDILRGTAAADTILGLGGNDDLFGLAGNDILNGGTGADRMTGGRGNDTYLVDNKGDKAIELSGQGTDLVKSKVTFTLGSNVENLTLTGTAAINGTGNTLANTIVGNTAANVLTGGLGADKMSGGRGNDTYVVDRTTDKAIEALNQGTDTVKSSVTWVLGANLENLTLTGTSAINGTGNELANRLTGNAAANILDGGIGADVVFGGGGADTIRGNDGADVMYGGAGADTFKYGNYSTDADADSGKLAYGSASLITAIPAGLDVIKDFNPAEGDKIDITEIRHINNFGNWELDFLADGPWQDKVGTGHVEVQYVSNVNSTFVYFDRYDGNTAVDFTIVLQGFDFATVGTSDWIYYGQ